MPPADQSDRSPQTLVRVMYVSAVVTVVLAVVLGALVSPFLYAIALFAVLDVLLARGYASGRLRMAADPRLGRPAEGGVVPGPGADSPEGGTSSDADAAAADPSYNPYARED